MVNYHHLLIKLNFAPNIKITKNGYESFVTDFVKFIAFSDWF